VLLKKPFFFGLSIVVLILLQAGVSFFSVLFFLGGDCVQGFVFFFIVPLPALLIGLYYVWFRNQRKVQSVK
jgi:hypothetical protein